MDQDPSRSRPGWKKWLPGVETALGYERSWLWPDLIAGLVLTALLVPQGMAYAELAGLPAVTGLYTTVAALLAYAVFGPSRILVLGPDSSLAPLIAAAIIPLAAGDDAYAVALASMLSLLVGGALNDGVALGDPVMERLGVKLRRRAKDAGSIRFNGQHLDDHALVESIWA